MSRYIIKFGNILIQSLIWELLLRSTANGNIYFYKALSYELVCI